MKIFSISDIHASDKNLKNYQLLICFLERCLKEKNLDQIILLGDIFDHMVGSHSEYYIKYRQFFEILDKLCLLTKVIFIEGNHDFHLKYLFYNRYQKKISYVKDVYLVKDNNLQLCYLHGDLIDYTNKSYHFFRSLIRSHFFDLFSNYFLKFKEAERIGQQCTDKSVKIWTDENLKSKTKNCFRTNSLQYHTYFNFDFLVLGHSHVKDYFQSSSFMMINNGYSGQELCFIKYEDEKLSFETLSLFSS